MTALEYSPNGTISGDFLDSNQPVPGRFETARRAGFIEEAKVDSYAGRACTRQGGSTREKNGRWARIAPLLSPLCLASIIGLPGPAGAQVPFAQDPFEEDDRVTIEDDAPPFSLNAYALAGYLFDSNPLRQSQAEIDALGLDGEDQIGNVAAGINTRYRISRQVLSFDARLGRFEYSDLDGLDHLAARIQARWNWRNGEYWSGDVGARYNRRLRDFANQLQPVIEIREEARLFGSVSRSLGSGWAIDLSGSTADVQFEETEALDLTRNTGELAVTYETALRSRFGVSARVVGGTFDSSNFRNFTETNVAALFTWPMSALTTFDARIGFTERDHRNPDRPDFNGVAGIVSLTRTAARENRFRLDLYRRPSNLGDEIANYALVEGISVTPQWSLSETLVLRLNAHVERRDFRALRDPTGVDPTVEELSPREDEIVGGGIWLDWNLIGRFSVVAGFETEDRSSNRDSEEFDYELLTLQLRADL